MTIKEQFTRDVIESISKNGDVTVDNLSESISKKGYRLTRNTLFNEKGEVLVKLTTKKERYQAYLMLRDYFENAFNDRLRYFKQNNKRKIYSSFITKHMKGRKIVLEKCEYWEGYDFNIQNKKTGENEYDLISKLNNIMLTQEEKEQFFKMLEWYVMNIPYSEWSHINIESAFVDDVISKYYVRQKKNKKEYKYIEKLLVMSEYGRPFESPDYRNTRFAWSDGPYYTIHDHYSDKKYAHHYFLTYDKEGIKTSDSVPRFHVEDIYLYSPVDGPMKIIVDNNGKLFNIETKQYVEMNRNHLIPLMDMIPNFGYSEFIKRIAIEEKEQIINLFLFIYNVRNNDLNQVKELCETTVETFFKTKAFISYQDGDKYDVDQIKKELSFGLIVDYYLNDGDFYYLFNIQDRSNEQPHKLKYTNQLYFIGNVGTLTFKDGAVTYKAFGCDKIDLCHIEDDKVVVDAEVAEKVAKKK
jgi:hypothetical protein